MFMQRPYKLVRPPGRPPERPNTRLHDDEELVDRSPSEPDISPAQSPGRPEQRLYRLDTSWTWFPEQLEELLRDEGWLDDLWLLQEMELVGVVDYLDNVRFINSTLTESCSSSPQILDGLDHTGSTFREGLSVLRELCSSRAILPTSYRIPGELSFSTMWPVSSCGSADIYRGSLAEGDVCMKQLRIYINAAKVKQVPHSHNLQLDHHILIGFKALCKEAVIWKNLDHPNIVPFKGVTLQPPQLVSEWMPGGHLHEYIKNNHRANLIGLASPSLPSYQRHLILSSVVWCRQRSWLPSFVQRGPRGSQRGTSHYSVSWHATADRNECS